MNTTLKGKIGRLPKGIREEVNRRIERGDTGQSVAGWLNELPEVQAVTAAQFDGRPVAAHNVSQWHRHGYKRWLWRQEAMAMAGEVRDLPTETATVVDNMTTWASVHYLMAVRELVEREAERQEAGEEPRSQLKLLQRFCKDVNSLRRVEHSGARLELMKARLERVGEKVILNIQQPTSNIEHPHEPQNGGTRHLTPALSPFDPSAPVKRGEGETLPASCRNTALGGSEVQCASNFGGSGFP